MKSFTKSGNVCHLHQNISQLRLNYIRQAQSSSLGMVTTNPKSPVISHIIARQTQGRCSQYIHFTATKRLSPFKSQWL
jgi:hypothetical protein